jgi:hypothetical protein
VEAGTYGDAPAYFRVVLPWTRPERMESAAGADPPFVLVLLLGLLILALVVAGVLARQHLRTGRGDRRGAMRLALYSLLVQLANVLLAGHHRVSMDAVGNFFRLLSYLLLVAAAVWVLYLALEPYARRLWPDLLISWNRLLAGRFRDPRVGRDVLLGAVAGILLNGWIDLTRFGVGWLQGKPIEPRGMNLDLLESAGKTVSTFLGLHLIALLETIVLLFFLVLFRAVLRKQWLAAAAVIIIASIIGAADAPDPLLAWPSVAAFMGVAIVVLLRLGFLAGAAMFFFQFMDQFALTGDLSAWYVPQSVLGLALAAGLAVYAFRIAVAGRPVPTSRP